MLVKDATRFQAFVDRFMTAVRKKSHSIPGPVHGSIAACTELGIEVGITPRGKLVITSPYGKSIAINSPDRTLFNLIIRDSIRHAILSHLRERTADPEHFAFRKDMVGVDPMMDIDATRVNIDHPRQKLVSSTPTTVIA